MSRATCSDKSSAAAGRNHCRTESRRYGFTLIETMIAIGLMTLLMAGLYSAMTMYLNLQLDSHDEIERLQIARTLLRQMSRDVQSVVFEEQKSIDDSSSGGSSSTSGSSGTGLSDSGSTAGAVEPAEVMTAYTNGLVGSETDLLLYISRPDRDLRYVSSQELKSFADRSGDLMIVRYFVAQKGGGGLASSVADAEGMSARSGDSGLVRMTGDLYGLSMAIDEDDDQGQASAATVVAREVVQIRFQYFDGSQWQPEWDSTSLNMLPQAVEITLTLRTAASTDPTAPETQDKFALGETTHRMVVNLPVAKPFVSETSL